VEAHRVLISFPHRRVADYEVRLAKIKQFARQWEAQAGVVVEIVIYTLISLAPYARPTPAQVFSLLVLSHLPGASQPDK
jgi:hypothetical protein